MAVLLEREVELAAAAAALENGGFLIVEGVAGIGKTALLAEMAQRSAAAGRRTLTASGTRLERVYGYGIARSLLGDVPADEGDVDEISSFRVLRELASSAVAAAEVQPLTILIDDAQWADTPSLRFAAFLARRLDGADIAVAVSIRTGEPDAPEELLDELRATPGARLLSPRPLSAGGTAALVQEADPEGTGELAQRFHEATAGNPLLVTELLRAVASGDEPLDAAARGLAGGVSRRIERSDPAATPVAQSVAVLGAEATLAGVASLSGLGPIDAGRAASTLVSADVLSPGPPYGFIHPLIAEAVLTAIDDGERIRLRRLAAEFLRNDDAGPERVASQLVLTPGTGDAETVSTLRDAAGAAVARGAAGSAVPLLLRALEEPPDRSARIGVLIELARAERLAGSSSCVDHARAALALESDPERRAALSRELARCQHDLSRYSDSATTLVAALREAPEDLPVGQRDALRVDLMTTAILSSAVDADQLVADLGRGVAPEDPGVQIAGRIAMTAMRLTNDEPVSAYAGEMAELLMAAPPAPDRLDAHTVMWWAMTMVEEHDTLRSQLDAVEQSGPGWMRRQYTINLARAQLEHRLGRLDEAVSAHEANLEVSVDDNTGRLFSEAGLATVLVDRGDAERAVAIVDSMEVPDIPDEGHIVHLHWARGRVLTAAARYPEAMDAFDRGWAIQRTFPSSVGLIWEGGASERIACLVALDRRDEARAVAEEVVDTARSRGLVGLEAIGRRSLGTLDGDRAALEEAAAMLSTTPMRLQCARAHLALGEHLRRAGERRAALEPLRAAADLGHACGARPLTARAREELRLIGARPRRDASTGRDSLTAAELRVAQLAADGRTNREIASELFITIKTVEGHLARIFRKLDIRSRTDIAARLEHPGS